MNKYTQTKTFDTEKFFSKRTFYILSGIFVAMFALYAYFLASITINIAEAKQLNISVRDTISEIATLEVEYLNQVNNISMESAMALGFAEPETLHFVYTEGETPSVAVLR